MIVFAYCYHTFPNYNHDEFNDQVALTLTKKRGIVLDKFNCLLKWIQSTKSKGLRRTV